MSGTKDLVTSHWAERLRCSLGGDELGVGMSVTVSTLGLNLLLFTVAVLLGVVSGAPVVVFGENLFVNLCEHTLLEETEQVPSCIE